jgi:hypothetical protein
MKRDEWMNEWRKIDRNKKRLEHHAHAQYGRQHECANGNSRKIYCTDMQCHWQENNSEARRDRGKRYTVRIRDKGNNRPNQDDIKSGRNRPGTNLRRQEEIHQILDIKSRRHLQEETYSTLQMKGRWESNINVWFPFMYSKKLNFAAFWVPKHN